MKKEAQSQPIEDAIIKKLTSIVFWVMNMWFLAGFLTFLLIPIALITMAVGLYGETGIYWIIIDALFLPLLLFGDGLIISSSSDLLLIFSFWTVIFSTIFGLVNQITTKRNINFNINKFFHMIYLSSYVISALLIIFLRTFSNRAGNDLGFLFGAFIIGYIFFGLYVITKRSISKERIKTLKQKTIS